MTGPDVNKKVEIAEAELAALGNGALGYIREIEAGHAAKLLGPQMNLPDNIRLFCLYNADGTPVSISGSFADAFAAAQERELIAVTVH
ncbi:MAG: DUF1150 family protein [Parvibaculaceae bacterium]|jgi:hypothetical protein